MSTKQTEALRLAEQISDIRCQTEGEARAIAAAADALCRQHERIVELEALAAGYDAARLEIASLLAQESAIGAGGVEPLRRRCLHRVSEPGQELGHSAQTIAMTANVAGLESAVAHLSCLLDAFRALLVEVDDVCGRDGFDRVLEEGESEIIDKIRAALAMTNAAPQPAAQALDAQTEPDHEALLAAAQGYIAASQRMDSAMQDGFNVHGAMSGIIGATDNLRAAIAAQQGDA